MNFQYKWKPRDRCLAVYQEPIEAIQLHSFGDASGNWVAACVYTVVEQRSGSNQGLVAARSRLPKRGLTIPRLELVAAHMAINLASNVKEALIGFPVTKVQCWSDIRSFYTGLQDTASISNSWQTGLVRSTSTKESYGTTFPQLLTLLTSQVEEVKSTVQSCGGMGQHGSLIQNSGQKT